jgi:MoaA/NifB/PqqE/SkfB family radical SAM enzyme
MNIPPPRFLSLQINKSCNLRCQHCDFWTLHDKDRDAYLTFERRYEILAEFASMCPEGRLVVCGGEPMLDLDAYFHATTSARRLGLTCLSVVNGTRIRSDEMANRMIAEGPHEISISLNSHEKDLHDRTRGIPGAFDKAVKAIKLLIEAKARAKSSTRIIVMGLVYKSNYAHLEQFYDFVLNDLRADALKLNFVQPKFGQATEDDAFFADETDVHSGRLLEILNRCNERFDLRYSEVWLKQVQMYFDSLSDDHLRKAGWASGGETRDHICNSYDRNIMVDHYGTARLCFSTRFPGMQLQRQGDLKKFWDSANAIRRCMKQCNAYCGISHSVRREASTVKGNAFRDEHAERYGTMQYGGFAGRMMDGLKRAVSIA